jgi:hypothetical protein
VFKDYPEDTPMPDYIIIIEWVAYTRTLREFLDIRVTLTLSLILGVSNLL